MCIYMYMYIYIYAYICICLLVFYTIVKVVKNRCKQIIARNVKKCRKLFVKSVC